MEEPTICPQCGSKFTNFGVLKANPQLPESLNRLLNEYAEPALPLRCTKCGDSVMDQCLGLLRQEQKELTVYLQEKIDLVPLVSSHSPFGWEYQTLGLVTAQSTIGTGIFTEVASSFADLFGTQAQAYNAKVKASEDLCQSMLRIKALEKGGDAIVAADIDYSEVGSGKGMVMVCMTGTVIKLHNPSVVNDTLEAEAETLRRTVERLNYLRELRPS